MKNRVEKIKKFNADFKRLPERQRRHATRIVRPNVITDIDYRTNSNGK